MMTESTIHTYAGKQSPDGKKDGFKEQVVILSQLSKELDEYFALRSVHK